MKQRMSNQRGFAMVVMMIIMISVVSSYMMLAAKIEAKNLAKQKAVTAGSQLRMYAHGVMRYIAENGTAVAVGAAPNSTAWLKPATCGGTAPGDGYLPCSFPDTTEYRDDYTTTITVTGNNVDAVISIPWPRVDGLRNGALGALVARSAGADLGPLSTTGNMIDPAMLGWMIVTEPVQTVATQTTEVTVSANVNTDIFLHTNGTNQMNADLNTGGNSIVNVLDVTATGTIQAADLIATNSTSTGTLEAIATKVVGGRNVSIESAGDITTSGSLVSAGDVDTLGEIYLGDPSVQAATSIVFRQAATASNNVVLTAQTNTSGGNTYNDLVISDGAGGSNVDLVADRVYNNVINRYMSQAIYNATVAKVGDIIPYPTCPTGMTGQIFTAADGFSLDIPEPVMLFDIRPVRTASGWRLDARLIGEDSGDISGTRVKSDIIAFTKCT